MRSTVLLVSILGMLYAVAIQIGTVTLSEHAAVPLAVCAIIAALLLILRG